MNKKSIQYLVFFLVICFPIIVTLILKTGNVVYKELPYYGQRTLSETGDTIFHSIPEFRFINQLNQEVSRENLEGKIVVANFFFSTCPTVCPTMIGKMAELHELYAARDDIRFASFTVDPKRDNPERLKAFAEQFGVNHNKWDMLTGPKVDLYELARLGFLVNADEANKEDAGSEHDFLHSEHFILLDKQGHIRGYYASTDADEIKRLKDEIVVLVMTSNEQ